MACIFQSRPGLTFGLAITVSSQIILYNQGTITRKWLQLKTYAHLPGHGLSAKLSGLVWSQIHHEILSRGSEPSVEPYLMTTRGYVHRIFANKVEKAELKNAV